MHSFLALFSGGVTQSTGKIIDLNHQAAMATTSDANEEKASALLKFVPGCLSKGESHHGLWTMLPMPNIASFQSEQAA